MDFYTKIAGVTFSNEGKNTQNRQRIIAELWQEGLLDEGTELTLRRDPHNPYDPNAVAVLAPDGRQLGFLPAETAKNVAPYMDQGVIYRAFVTTVTGGDADSFYGVNLKIVYDPEQQDDLFDQESDADSAQEEEFESSIDVPNITKTSKDNGRSSYNMIKRHTQDGRQLLVCPDCGGKVSRRAEACPHCGCPIRVILGDARFSMKQRAEAGDVEAQLQLAEAYHFGDRKLSIRQDDEASKIWLLRAAVAGSRTAYNYLEEWYVSPEEDFVVENVGNCDCGGIDIKKYIGFGGILVIPGRPCDFCFIDDNAFKDCTSITGIALSNYGSSDFSYNIGSNAFKGCSNLTGVALPQAQWSRISIFECTFQDCINLKYISIPKGVVRIDYHAFGNCKKLKSILIPESVELIEVHAFQGCKDLKNFRVESKNDIFELDDGVIKKKEGRDHTINAWIGAPREYLLLKGAARIGHFSFLPGLTSIEIPDSVKEIERDAFYGCTGLTSIEIPNSVTKVGPFAFAGCTGLTSIKIPNSVTEIGWKIFEGCTGLTNIEISNSVTEIAEGTFSKCTGLTRVEIPNSVTDIGEGAFYGCTGLTDIKIPNSVTKIGKFAFQHCTGLISVEIPNSVTKIGEYAFHDCTGLITVEIPNSVTEIGKFVFQRCTGLTDIKIPNSVTKIGENAFHDCTGLISVEIPNSVTEFGEWAFNGCTGLTSVEFPNSVTKIEKSAFGRCTGLISVEIPNSVTDIGEGAFYGCTGLTNIKIPNSVTEIGWHAFEGCPKLVIFAHKNSAAAAYAAKWNLQFKALED